MNKRQQHRERKRQYASEKVRNWNIGLATHKTLIKEHARREWNHERLYTKIKQLIPSLTREELKEYLQHHQITQPPKPKPHGKLI